MPESPLTMHPARLCVHAKARSLRETLGLVGFLENGPEMLSEEEVREIQGHEKEAIDLEELGAAGPQGR